MTLFRAHRQRAQATLEEGVGFLLGLGRGLQSFLSTRV